MQAIINFISTIRSIKEIVSNAPSSCKTHLSRYLHAKYAPEESILHYDIFIRLLRLNQRAQSTELPSALKLFDYVARCKTFLDENDKTLPLKALSEFTKDETPNLIYKAKQYLFLQCLQREYLTNDFQEDNFSDLLLERAKKAFFEIMLRESLITYEITRLAERYDNPAYQCEFEKTFIDRILKENVNLRDYTLEGSRLVSSLLLKHKFFDREERRLSDKYKQFLQEHRENYIDPMVIQCFPSESNKVKLRMTLGAYFDPQGKGETPLFNAVWDDVYSAQFFLKGIQCSTHTLKLDAITFTNDKLLSKLRNLVNLYQNRLTNKNELPGKQNASTKRVTKSRLQILAALEMQLNAENKLTPDLCTLGMALIHEVKKLRPSWKELPIIQRIIDVLMIGFTYLIRNIRDQYPCNKIHGAFKAAKAATFFASKQSMTPHQSSLGVEKISNNALA